MPKKQQVVVGSKVAIKFEDGYRDTFLIVYSLKNHTDIKVISTESPLGQAILGRCENEKIKYLNQTGQKIFCEITKVK